MSKIFNKKIFLLATVLIAVLVVGLSPLKAEASCGIRNPMDCVNDALGLITVAILQLFGLILYLGGSILNLVLKHTVVDMRVNLEAIGEIETLWVTIRDIANMSFIFVLLYSAIQYMLGVGKNIQKTVVTVIVVAILMNFSLFFTRVVIDFSNVLAIAFYGSMVPEALTAGGEGSIVGLSDAIMKPLGLQSIMDLTDSKQIGPLDLLIIGVMGSILFLVASFVFFAAAILFAIRYVVLMFIMILSPLALMSWILPNLKKSVWDKWKDALFGQAFFAPIFFLLVWIAIKVSQALPGANPEKEGYYGSYSAAITGVKVVEEGNHVAKADPSSIGLLMTFVIIITLLITALTVAKSYANKAGSTVTSMTKWATGVAGKATFGTAGRLGRSTVGAAGSALADSEKYKEMAAKGGARGMAARLALAAGRKTASTNFDMRGTVIGKSLGAGKAQKGGYGAELKARAKAKKEEADALKPSDLVVKEAEDALKIAESSGDKEAIKTAKTNLDKVRGVSEDEAKKRITEELKKNNISKKRIDKFLKSEIGKKRIKREMVKSIGDERKESYAESISKPGWVSGERVAFIGKVKKSSKQAAVDIRKSMKGKKVEDIVKEALKKSGELKDEGDSGGDEEETNNKEASSNKDESKSEE